MKTPSTSLRSKVSKHLNITAKGAIDFGLISVLMALAACGLMYEYIMSHYAGRVLGLMEHAIFAMIGVMIVAMGCGSLVAKKFRDANLTFVVVELLIAFLGSASVLLIAGATALQFEMPRILAQTFQLPPEYFPVEGLSWITWFAQTFPFFIGFLLGVLVGMEIPLIARIREEVYARRLMHNTGTVYGADYLGAGIGAAIFILYLLKIPPTEAVLWVAAMNLFVGFVFLFLRWHSMKARKTLVIIHFLGAVFLGWLSLNVGDLHQSLENSLYNEDVVFSHTTEFQHITVTQRGLSNGKSVHTLYLNGRLQFCSCDEALYHSMLTLPPALASARQDKILLIGGGDGLAVRDLLRLEPSRIDVLELDQQMIDLFSRPEDGQEPVLSGVLLEMNERAFLDPRVNVIIGDAYNSVNQLIDLGQTYDMIIIDLPDPTHPDLNKLYSIPFYEKIRFLLSADGAVSVQSTSPYHTRKAFLTIGVTLRAAGFDGVERYHTNIPSFGEWGWTIATKRGVWPLERIKSSTLKISPKSAAGRDFIIASFSFPTGLLEGEAYLKANSIDSNLLYFLHEESWQIGETKLNNG